MSGRLRRGWCARSARCTESPEAEGTASTWRGVHRALRGRRSRARVSFRDDRLRAPRHVGGEREGGRRVRQLRTRPLILAGALLAAAPTPEPGIPPAAFVARGPSPHGPAMTRVADLLQDFAEGQGELSGPAPAATFGEAVPWRTAPGRTTIIYDWPRTGGSESTRGLLLGDGQRSVHELLPGARIAVALRSHRAGHPAVLEVSDGAAAARPVPVSTANEDDGVLFDEPASNRLCLAARGDAVLVGEPRIVAPETTPDARPRWVAIVIEDALRGDVLDPPLRAEAPTLAALAEGGLTFTNASSPASHTMAAVVPVLMGRDLMRIEPRYRVRNARWSTTVFSAPQSSIYARPNLAITHLAEDVGYHSVFIGNNGLLRGLPAFSRMSIRGSPRTGTVDSAARLASLLPRFADERVLLVYYISAPHPLLGRPGEAAARPRVRRAHRRGRHALRICPARTARGRRPAGAAGGAGPSRPRRADAPGRHRRSRRGLRGRLARPGKRRHAPRAHGRLARVHGELERPARAPGPERPGDPRRRWTRGSPPSTSSRRSRISCARRRRPGSTAFPVPLHGKDRSRRADVLQLRHVQPLGAARRSPVRLVGREHVRRAVQRRGRKAVPHVPRALVGKSLRRGRVDRSPGGPGVVHGARRPPCAIGWGRIRSCWMRARCPPAQSWRCRPRTDESSVIAGRAPPCVASRGSAGGLVAGDSVLRAGDFDGYRGQYAVVAVRPRPRSSASGSRYRGEPARSPTPDRCSFRWMRSASSWIRRPPRLVVVTDTATGASGDRADDPVLVATIGRTRGRHPDGAGDRRVARAGGSGDTSVDAAPLTPAKISR